MTKTLISDTEALLIRRKYEYDEKNDLEDDQMCRVNSGKG